MDTSKKLNKNSHIRHQNNIISDHRKSTAQIIALRSNTSNTIQLGHLGENQMNYLQRVVGNFLYYARAIDKTMLHALNNIVTATSKGTQATLAAVEFSSIILSAISMAESNTSPAK